MWENQGRWAISLAAALSTDCKGAKRAFVIPTIYLFI